MAIGRLGDSHSTDISDPSYVSEFLLWARGHIAEAVGIDRERGLLFLRKYDQPRKIPVHFEPVEWTRFVEWFKTVGGPGGEVSREALFDLLSEYIDQGLYQSMDVTELALHNYGIWPPGPVPKSGEPSAP